MTPQKPLFELKDDSTVPQQAQLFAQAMSSTFASSSIDPAHPLPMTLSMAVPLWAMTFRKDKLSLPEILDGERLKVLLTQIQYAGEALIYNIPGKTAQGFNALAEAIARLSFCPGGIKCFGQHWEHFPDVPTKPKHKPPGLFDRYWDLVA